VLNEFNARKPDQLNIFKGITGNRLFMAIIAVTVVLQVKALKYFFAYGGCCYLGFCYCLFLYCVQVLIIEFLGKFMSTVRLSWQLWLVSIGLAFVR
jgi:Ca2+-transporting ATPase